MAEITWIKLKTDMFDDEKIKLIERMPEGDGILIIWVKLLAYAGKVNCSGYIMIAEDIPMNIEEMAIIFNRPLEKVRYAIQVLQRYRMIEVDENERICISNWEKHQNIDGMEKVRLQTAERNRKYRERKKQQALQAPSDVPQSNGNDVSVTSRDGTDKDLDKDLDIDKEIDKETDIDKDSQSSVSPLTDTSFLEIKNAFEANVRTATFKDVQEIDDAMNVYEPALILEAIKAGASNARSFKYIVGILDNWRLEFKVKTYADWQQKIQSKGGKAHGNTGPANAAHLGRTPEEIAMLERLRTYSSKPTE